jgi:hypothetical protein
MHTAATFADICSPTDRGLGAVAFNARRATLGAELKAFADECGINADLTACEIAAGSMLAFPTAACFGLDDTPMGMGIAYAQAGRVARAYVDAMAAARKVAA